MQDGRLLRYFKWSTPIGTALLTKAKYDTRHQRFSTELDTDKDGTLDAKELRGHLNEQDFQANDTDHDNTLTKDEYLAIVEQRFKSTDTNHDGKLKIDELTSAPGAALVKLITFQIEGVHP